MAAAPYRPDARFRRAKKGFGVSNMNKKSGLALGALLLITCGPAFAAEFDGRLTGAWATSPAECQKLFVRGGGGFAFRQPVDQFAQAAIITPGSIVMPNQTCQVTGSTQNNGLTTLQFQCKDSISYTTQSVEIEIKSSTSDGVSSQRRQDARHCAHQVRAVTRPAGAGCGKSGRRRGGVRRPGTASSREPSTRRGGSR